MNFVSFVACLWLLGGTLLTYGFPDAPLRNNEFPPKEFNPQKTAESSRGKPEVNTDNQSVGADPHSDSFQIPSSSSNSTGSITTTTESINATGIVNTSESTHAPSSTTPTTISTTTSTTLSTTQITTTEPPTTSTQPSTLTTNATSIPTVITTVTTPNATIQSTTHLAPTSITPNSTQAPEPTKPTSAPETDRRFDGPSFIGGMVLALGATAIGFVAWKFYKARTERNYHTL